MCDECDPSCYKSNGKERHKIISTQIVCRGKTPDLRVAYELEANFAVRDV